MSRMEVRAFRRESFYAYWLFRSLGGNLSLDKQTNDYTPIFVITQILM